MAKRNFTTYRGEFTGLQLDAFGIKQTVAYSAVIEIYQARVSPELWRARPSFARGGHNWEATSPEELMQTISGDFAGIIRPWRVWRTDPMQPGRPTLVSSRTQPESKAG